MKKTNLIINICVIAMLSLSLAACSGEPIKTSDIPEITPTDKITVPTETVKNETSVPTEVIATNTPVPATDTPMPTATNTPTPTATSTPAPTATNTPEPTATNTPAPTDTPMPTSTPVPTATPMPTATSTPMPTATNTPTPTATSTPAPTATNTPVPTATSEPTPSADKDTKDTKDNKNGTKVSKEYDVNHFKPFKEVTSTFNTVKLSDSFGSGDFSFKSGQLILGDVYSGVFSSWLAENSLFGEQDAFDFLSEEQIAEFNKINIIPTISKTNTKGLTTETILGSKEEATEILDAWLEARNADRINTPVHDYANSNYVYENLYGVTSYTIEDGVIYFKSYDGKLGIGVNNTKFGYPVYSATQYNIANGQMDDKDIADQKLADMEILSLISSDPYDLVMKLYDGDKGETIAQTVYDEWFRINDMMVYHSSDRNWYFKPVE